MDITSKNAYDEFKKCKETLDKAKSEYYIKVTHRCPLCDSVVVVQQLGIDHLAACYTCGKVFRMDMNSFKLIEWAPKFTEHGTCVKVETVRIISQEDYKKMMHDL